jgi:hypothetical protein
MTGKLPPLGSRRAFDRGTCATRSSTLTWKDFQIFGVFLEGRSTIRTGLIDRLRTAVIFLQGRLSTASSYRATSTPSRPTLLSWTAHRTHRPCSHIMWLFPGISRARLNTARPASVIKSSQLRVIFGSRPRATARVPAAADRDTLDGGR